MSKGINNSPLREKRLVNNKRHQSPGAISADIVTTNSASYRKFVLQYTGFSRSETRNTIHDFKAVIIALNEYYANYAMDTGNLILLPNNLGKFGVRKFKKVRIQKPDGTFNMRMDMNIYKKTGERVYHTNDHTDGNSFRWFWIKPENLHGMRDMQPGRKFHAAYWKLKPARSLQLQLSGRLKQEGYDWNKYHYMTDRIRERLIRNRMEREAKGNA